MAEGGSIPRPDMPPEPFPGSVPGQPRKKIPLVNPRIWKDIEAATTMQRPSAPPHIDVKNAADAINGEPAKETKKRRDSNAKRLDITNLLLTRMVNLTEQMVTIMEQDLSAATKDRLNQLREKQKDRGLSDLKSLAEGKRQQKSATKKGMIGGLLDLSVWQALGKVLQTLVIPFLIGFGLELAKHFKLIKKAKTWVTDFFIKFQKLSDMLGDWVTKNLGLKSFGSFLKKLPELLVPAAAIALFFPRLTKLILSPFTALSKLLLKFSFKPFLKAEGFFKKFLSLGKVFGRFTGVLTIIMAAAEGIKDFVTTLMAGKGLGEALRKGAVGVVDGLVGSWVRIIQNILGGILKLFGASKLANLIEKFDFKEWFGNITEKLGSLLADFVGAIVKKFKDFTSGGFLSMIGKILFAIPNAIMDFVKSVGGFDMKAYLIKLIDMLPAPAAKIIKKMMGLYGSAEAGRDSGTNPNMHMDEKTQSMKKALLSDMAKDGRPLSNPVQQARMRQLHDYNKSNGNSDAQATALDNIDARQALAGSKKAPVKIAKSGSMLDALGSVSAEYESNGSAGAVSSGAGDLGGTSYGTYQLSSSNGSVQKFLSQSGYEKDFAGLTPGSDEFNAKWRALGHDAKFGQAQHEYIKKTHYDPLAASTGLGNRGKGVQEMLFSTGVQFGGHTSLIEKALAGRNVAKMSDEDIIKAVQEYKMKHNDELFKSSSSKVRAGVLKRDQREETQLLAMSKQNANQKVVATTAASPTNVTSVKGGNKTVQNSTYNLNNDRASTPIVFAPHVMPSAA